LRLVLFRRNEKRALIHPLILLDLTVRLMFSMGLNCKKISLANR
jgi:hypothetical protein